MKGFSVATLFENHCVTCYPQCIFVSKCLLMKTGLWPVPTWSPSHGFLLATGRRWTTALLAQCASSGNSSSRNPILQSHLQSLSAPRLRTKKSSQWAEWEREWQTPETNSEGERLNIHPQPTVAQTMGMFWESRPSEPEASTQSLHVLCSSRNKDPSREPQICWFAVGVKYFSLRSACSLVFQDSDEPPFYQDLATWQVWLFKMRCNFWTFESDKAINCIYWWKCFFTVCEGETWDYEMSSLHWVQCLILYRRCVCTGFTLFQSFIFL